MKSAAPTEWTTRVYGIVPDSTCEHLLVAREVTPSLPGAVLPHRTRGWGAGRVVAEVGNALGIPLRLTRWLLLEENELEQVVDLALVFDPPVDDPPSGWTWTDSAEGLSGFAHRAARTWLEERGKPMPRERAPWAREGTGWFAGAVDWIDATLAHAGTARTGPVEQLRVWSISCVMRAPTEKGNVFFKAAARLPLFVDEPALTLRLAAWWPQESPDVIAIEPECGWLLMHDFGPSIRTRLDDAAQAADDGTARSAADAAAARMLTWVARRHQESAPRAAELLAAGCHDRGLERTLDHARTLLHSELTAATLNADELKRLKELEPRIEAMLADLARAGIPASLVHGDLHLGNVAECGGQMVVFDWTDAAVGHPFVDLLVWTFVDEPERRDRLGQAYLGAWPPEQRRLLMSVWHLLPMFLHLYHAISYHELIANIEPAARAEMSGLGSHLRGLIDTLETAGLGGADSNPARPS